MDGFETALGIVATLIIPLFLLGSSFLISRHTLKEAELQIKFLKQTEADKEFVRLNKRIDELNNKILNIDKESLDE